MQTNHIIQIQTWPRQRQLTVARLVGRPSVLMALLFVAATLFFSPAPVMAQAGTAHQNFVSIFRFIHWSTICSLNLALDLTFLFVP